MGRGGMGEVWDSVDRVGRRRVALKLLTAEAARDEKFRMAFRNEIRSAAQLDHPNLVAVLDYGEVTELEEAASGHKLTEGTPWLAMEMVDGTTLLPHCGSLDWARFCEVATGMLAALGHAHARGVYHRDLKPANVLLGKTRRSKRLQVKLSDFGLAHAADGTEETHFYGGTPSFMAPEQFDGLWRNYGPWTDLYGLGCLLFAAIRGGPPFGRAKTFPEARDNHYSATVPALDPPFPVPAGFESWLRRLLEKEPVRRYRRAADALYDFHNLGPPPATTLSLGHSIPPTDLDTIRLHTLPDIPDPTGTDPGPGGFSVGSSMARPPPLPATWRDAGYARPHRSLRAGLKLFGMRQVPLVGRIAERDQLWEALARVREHNRVEVVALHGPSGLGKSRLAQWLCQRADEVGSAITMQAVHGQVPGPGDGLMGMANRFLRCSGLDNEAIQQRVDAVAAGNPEEREALLELLVPGLGAMRFGSAEERHFATRQLLMRATMERPVVMWLDDVQWGPDSLRFVRGLLEQEIDRPVLIVMTASDEALAERMDEYAVWEELLAHPRTEAVSIDALAAEDRGRLIQEVLGLERNLGQAVEEGTNGNPMFVVQLLDDWVERGLLIATDEGFVLRNGVVASVPPNVGSVWRRRVRRLLENRPEDDGKALELAATLGVQVNQWEWVASARALGLNPRPDLLEVMLDARLAIAGEGGFSWAFVHRSVPAALRERAEEAGRLPECHGACAATVALRIERAPSVPAGLSERLGRHLLGAGEPENALEPLLVGIEERVNAGDYALAEDLLVMRSEALEAAGILPSDLRWGTMELQHFHIARRQGRRDEARAWLDAIVDAAVEHNWAETSVQCQIYMGRLGRQAGELDTAHEVLQEALMAAIAIEEPTLVADARFELGEVEAVRGNLPDAETWIRSALVEYENTENAVGQAQAWQCLGEIVKESGKHAEAFTILQKAEQLFQAAGNRWGQASAVNSQGDAVRHEGRLEDAEALYRRSGSMFRAIGSASAVYPEYNLALTWVARGEVGKALPSFEAGLSRFLDQHDGVGVANAHLALATCAGYAGQWILWDEHMREGSAMVEQIQAADEDTAWIAEVAGDCAFRSEQSDRARTAYAVALGIWGALDQDSKAHRVQSRLDAL